MDLQFLKSILNVIQDFFRRWRFRYYLTLAYFSYWRSLLRRPNQVISTWTNGAPLGPRVAIFVHYDAEGTVQPFVMPYLQALHDLGLSVVFVTNSGKLTEAAQAALRPLCTAILIRRNIGYDFGAMRDGIEFANLPQADTEMLLIVNDSVYGPLGDMKPMLDAIDFERADVWGATESYQNRYHLQSFFIAVGRRALESKGWKAFWQSVRPVKAKLWVILNYEIGMTRAMLKQGLRCASVYPYKDLLTLIDPTPLAKLSRDTPDDTDPFVINRKTHLSRLLYSASHRMPMNPTAELWRQLMIQRFPFMKRELLRDNPASVIDLADWREMAREVFDADLRAIDDDLQRVLRDKTP
jgi:lipopolysaccharide biosynthesis protein